MRFLLPTFLLSAAHLALASNVLDLNSNTFENFIGKGKPAALVEFFAPWCGHCKKLAPIYEQLGDAFAHAKDKVQIVKVDADGEGKAVGQKYGVTGFPTLKWFPADGGEPIPYESGRELEDLVSFVEGKTNVKSNIAPPPPPATLNLNLRTFDDVVMDADKDVLVAFTAPWCGHCKALKPTFNTVATNFKSDTNCVIADFDADNKGNSVIAGRYDVQSFPTIKFFPRGSTSKTPEDYKGERSEKAFVDFLNSKCGTHRAVGGGLNDEAGRIPDFDSLASQYFVAAPSARQAILTRASDLAKSAQYVEDKLSKASKHYLRVMEKIGNQTESWVAKESNRLQAILSKKKLSPAKLDEIKIKANILAAFKEAKEEDKTKTVDEEAEVLRAREEL